MTKTKRILIISSDTELISYLKISSMTLTKLNCQVSFENTDDHESAVRLSKDVNMDLVLLDLDMDPCKFEPGAFLKNLRSDKASGSKKVIGFYSGEIDKDFFHSAGCDSIMNKNELMRNAVNIIQF